MTLGAMIYAPRLLIIGGGDCGCESRRERTMDGRGRHVNSKRSESFLVSSSVTATPAQSTTTPRRAARTCSSAVSADPDAEVVRTPRQAVALPHAASQVTKARRIRLYRNGDTYYEGSVFVLAPENFRTFDSLLRHINMSPLADPSVLKKVTVMSFHIGLPYTEIEIAQYNKRKHKSIKKHESYR